MNDRHFIDKGYGEARIVVRLLKDGKAVAHVPVVLTVADVTNQSAAMPEGQAKRNAGLSWQKAIPGNAAPVGEFESKTDEAGQAKALLTDIIGERAVLVAAKAVFNGDTYEAEQTVVFGKGPLSLFASPITEPLTWLELYEVCNGEPYAGDPAGWEIGAGRVGGKMMPAQQEIQAVSLPGKYNSPSAMGAAIAAGWPDDRRYWNGRGVMRMRAGHVSLRDGNPHGSGGNDVRNSEYGVCLR